MRHDSPAHVRATERGAITAGIRSCDRLVAIDNYVGRDMRCDNLVLQEAVACVCHGGGRRNTTCVNVSNGLRRRRPNRDRA